jgi:hypothetical protein
LREPRALAALGAVLVAAAGLVGFRVGRRQGTARS